MNGVVNFSRLRRDKICSLSPVPSMALSKLVPQNVITFLLILDALFRDEQFLRSATFDFDSEENDGERKKYVDFSDSRRVALDCALDGLIDGNCVPMLYRAGVQYFTDHQYSIEPGEVDSFGWLTGLLKTPMGYYVFG